MIKWGFVFILIAMAAGAVGFGGSGGALANVMGDLFFVFLAVSVVLFFAAVVKAVRPIPR